MANAYNDPDVILRKFIEKTYEGRFEDNVMTNVAQGKFRSPGHTSVFLGEQLNPGYNGGTGLFRECPGVESIVLPKITQFGTYGCYLASGLLSADIGENCTILGTNIFEKASLLTTIILRRSTAPITLHGSAFNNTRFASGGAGGTIYIPKALYDHLGDGGSLDYKAASNWSTWNSYGTITWAKIEGSQYEHYYVDGTPIPAS